MYDYKPIRGIVQLRSHGPGQTYGISRGDADARAGIHRSLSPDQLPHDGMIAMTAKAVDRVHPTTVLQEHNNEAIRALGASTFSEIFYHWQQ
jgi:hypothetical protein